MPDVIEERAPAKVNLHLEVTARRPDGFHELETVMAEVDLADRLTFAPGGDALVFEVSDPSVGLGEDNLAVRAVRAVEKAVGRSLPGRLTLEKRIPAGGGLGGGSSDAAAAIRAVVRAYGLEVDVSEQERLCAEVGSDVAFFIRGGVSLCTGRGEKIEPLDCPEGFHLLLLLPGLHVPTADVYRSLTLTGTSVPFYDCVRSVASGDVAGLRRALFNRLEAPAFAVFPGLTALSEALALHRPLLSGSGSTFFVLCDDEDDARRRKTAIEEMTGLSVLLARTASR